MQKLIEEIEEEDLAYEMFDEAIIGYTENHLPIYDYVKMIIILKRHMPVEDAVNYVDYYLLQLPENFCSPTVIM